MTELVFKWSGKEFQLQVEANETISSLKRKIQEQTNVQPKRQKLLGLKSKSGHLAADDVLIADLAIKPGQKILVMGAPEADIEATDRQAEVAPHVQDDFDDINETELQEASVKHKEINREKLRRRLASVEVPVLNSPRPGKKCLVLDIDYTIFDLGSAAERPEELARPYLHEFLTAVYEFYDIIIWSANSMKWIEVKMRELGVSSHPDYKLTCFLDHKAMVTVKTERRGVFNCKPLPFLWAKFPDVYNEDNTIMFDDLRRNYIFNKQNGLVIKPFVNAHTNRRTDKELLMLKIYLLKIARLESLKSLRHSRWEDYIKQELIEQGLCRPPS